jgi:hypothetical protein
MVNDRLGYKNHLRDTSIYTRVQHNCRIVMELPWLHSLRLPCLFQVLDNESKKQQGGPHYIALCVPYVVRQPNEPEKRTRLKIYPCVECVSASTLQRPVEHVCCQSGSARRC